jgi:hypothetical protein
VNGDEDADGESFARALRSTNMVVRFSTLPERTDSVEGVGVELREMWNLRGNLTGKVLVGVAFCGADCRILWKIWESAIAQQS